MSTKPKSKSASAGSPAPGKPSGTEGDDAAPSGDAEAAPGRGDAVTVYLVSDRHRRGSWMLGGLVVGGLLYWKFGTVAAGVGLLLIALGLYHTWFFLRTLRFDAGAVVAEGDTLQLPRGLCSGSATTLATSDLRAAYFLRSAVPWNRSAPVLVIEAGEQAYLLPRDWFASEADQRRVMHAVLPRIANVTDGRAADGDRAS